MPNLEAWLTLHLTPGLGPAACKRLTDFFGDPQKVLEADRQSLSKVPGVKKSSAEALAQRPAKEEVEKEINDARTKGVTIITWEDATYPDLLRNIHTPPMVLYTKGLVEHLNSPCLAIVGARAATSYGRQVSENMAYQLAQYDITVVSGLALGIDAAAHNGALDANGRTIAVLGCGIDIVYPRQNQALYEKISQKGLLLSEYPFGTQPESFRFPARNRIISGLSLGVLVVEAARRSGSLITAELALEQGREVFAIPGMVHSPKSEGAHRLLKEGAKLVQHVDDILEELPLKVSSVSQAEGQQASQDSALAQTVSPEEMKVFSFLEVYPKPIDEIIAATGLTASTVNELLLLLELKGMVASLPGNQYQKKVAVICS